MRFFSITVEISITKAGSVISIGWREWVSIPGLHIPLIQAKIDTGARTSALHTCKLETFHDHGVLKVRFQVHPLQKREDKQIECIAKVIDQRNVTDSGGGREMRLVIRQTIVIGHQHWPIEITLTDRRLLQFRMLLGRTALAGRAQVNPARSFVAGRPEKPMKRKTQ